MLTTLLLTPHILVIILTCAGAFCEFAFLAQVMMIMIMVSVSVSLDESSRKQSIVSFG